MRILALLLLCLPFCAYAKRAEMEGPKALTLSKILRKYDVGTFASGQFNVNIKTVSCTGPGDPYSHVAHNVTCTLRGFNALDRSHSKTISSSDRTSPQDAVSIFTILRDFQDSPKKRPPRILTISARKIHCDGLTSSEAETRCRFDY